MKRAFKGVWIPKEVWESKELTLQEKVFLVEIDSLDNEDGCYASNSYFADFFKLSKNRCSEIIKSLEKKGLISIIYMREPDQKNIKKRVIRVVGKPNRGIRKTEGGYSENREGINTSFNNTKDIVPFAEIIEYLNKKAGTGYKPSTAISQRHIRARWNEGFTLDDFKKVIDVKCKEWLDNKDMRQYLRPATLFGTKFESYLNQYVPKGSPENKIPVSKATEEERDFYAEIIRKQRERNTQRNGS